MALQGLDMASIAASPANRSLTTDASSRSGTNPLRWQQGPNPFDNLDVWKRQNFRSIDVEFAINIIRDFVRSELTTGAVVLMEMSKQGWSESYSELLATKLDDTTAVKDALAALCQRLQTRYKGATAVLPLLQALFGEYADIRFQHAKLTAERDCWKQSFDNTTKSISDQDTQVLWSVRPREPPLWARLSVPVSPLLMQPMRQLWKSLVAEGVQTEGALRHRLSAEST